MSSTSNIKLFRIDVRVRNNRMIRLREELGLTPRQLAEKIGISYGLYLDYESLKVDPLYKDCEQNLRLGNIGWKEPAAAIAAFHGVGPEELWPEAIRQVKKPTMTLELDPQRMAEIGGVSRALPPSPEEVVIDNELHDELRRLFTTLLPLEEKVLRLRFGIGARGKTTFGPERTLEEVATLFGKGWTRERIRLLESRALKKLRHRSRSKFLEIFVEEPVENDL